MARCPSSSSPRAEERPMQVCDDCGEVEGVVAGRRPDSVRRCGRSVRRRSLDDRLFAQSRMVEKSGLRDLQPASLVGRRLDRVQRQDGPAGARAGVCRQGTGVCCRTRERLDRSQQGWRCAELVAGRESPVLLVGSRRLSVPVGATSRSGDEAAGRGAARASSTSTRRGCRGGTCTSARRILPSRATRLSSTWASIPGTSG